MQATWLKMAEQKDDPNSKKKEQIVDPWTVSAAEGEDKIDYDKLISKHLK